MVTSKVSKVRLCFSQGVKPERLPIGIGPVHTNAAEII